MTSFSNVSSDTEQIWISWTPPEFNPYYYQLKTSCRLQCDNQAYHLTEVTMGSFATSTLITSLRPRSVCLIKLVAVYNPASIDPGMGLSARTYFESKPDLLKLVYSLYCV